ncbi:hypothetical protein AVEN_33187-1 [Araneus ventricosus]|uniref:Uncharacterized protein n=1 Tax=Araneus ventricosus TaxID=182803 RepID=A0A4Y2MCM4_ARAVE|nr:hypothetical protein AVEN_33187-1 [Araneus ventricosus]
MFALISLPPKRRIFSLSKKGLKEITLLLELMGFPITKAEISSLNALFWTKRTIISEALSSSRTVKTPLIFDVEELALFTILKHHATILLSLFQEENLVR